MLDIHGYTTLMSPEAMQLPYLETLLSWSKLCDSITVLYSRFPNLEINVPEGAVIPWKDDDSLNILKQFNESVLDNKLIIIDNHYWDVSNPLEDGATKQISRTVALDQIKDKNKGWVAQFDADEILNDGQAETIIQEIVTNNNLAPEKQSPFILTGILELFGSPQTVRFGFGNWAKIRLTRYLPMIQHGLPLRINGMAVRGRHPETNKFIAIDNRDDGAGYIHTQSLSRPDYNQALLLVDSELLNTIFMLKNNIPSNQLEMYLQKAVMQLNQSLNNDVWLYHTSWIDIKRKWSMGWFFDNFFSVLSGRQTTFEEKPMNGNFTRVHSLDADKDLKKELANPLIRPIMVNEPSVIKEVEQWRIKNGLRVGISNFGGIQ